MTMDQPGQARDTGYVVRGDVVPDGQAGVSRAEQTMPMTRVTNAAFAQVSTPDPRDALDSEETADPALADGAGAGQRGSAPAAVDLRPGESDPAPGDFSDLTHGNLLPGAAEFGAAEFGAAEFGAAEFKARWHQIQFAFVDDPRGSVAQAADVIAQVTARLEAAIQERQRAIAERQRTLRGRWGDGANADTETLRQTLRMYRVFLDQLTGSRAS